MAANASNQNKKEHISTKRSTVFEFDDVDIKLYVFCDAEAMCGVIGDVRGEVMLM